jgi:hypothetical protein
MAGNKKTAYFDYFKKSIKINRLNKRLILDGVEFWAGY